MLMHILFAIFTATYTLVSTTAVEQTGNAPDNATYTFERTATSGQRGQMTAGNSTTLTLAGWENTTIRSISLEMHSNSKSGAGSLQVQVGNKLAWVINQLPFADEQWAGTFTSQWVDIQKDMSIKVENGDLIQISISSTENSLYINSYTIVYESKQTVFHTVNFITGMDTHPAPITQDNFNAPITLPTWKDTADWHFVGWSEFEITEHQTIDNIYKAADEYTPDTTCTLWAVYANTQNNLSVTNYCSGEYIITMRNILTESVAGSGLAMNGNINQGVVSLSPVEMEKNSQHQYLLKSQCLIESTYTLEFNVDNTLTITHAATGEPIGYNGEKLANTLSKWNYRIIEDSSLVIYYIYNKKTYALYFGLNKSSEIVACSQWMNIDLWTNDALWLFPLFANQYTSRPLEQLTAADDAIEIQPNNAETQWIFGNYHLIIRDGKKFLHINH